MGKQQRLNGDKNGLGSDHNIQLQLSVNNLRLKLQKYLSMNNLFEIYAIHA